MHIMYIHCTHLWKKFGSSSSASFYPVTTFNFDTRGSSFINFWQIFEGKMNVHKNVHS